MNVQNYDLILGTLFLFQHKVMIGLNGSCVVIGSKEPLPIKGDQVQVLESHAAEVLEEQISEVRQQLYELAKPLCTKASETELPPLRAINHQLPIIDHEKVYPWRPSRCPEALRSQWVEKRRAYLETGHWRVTTNVVDLHKRNKNTHKLSASLPDIDGILRRVSKGCYRSIIDGQDAYEQIRIIPEHVE